MGLYFFLIPHIYFMDKELIKNILIVVVVIAIILLGMFGLKSDNADEVSVNIFEFSGRVESVEGDIIALEGAYSGPFTGTSEVVSDDIFSVRSFSFKVDSNTQFEKVERKLPDFPDLGENGSHSESFSLEDLPKTESVGSLADLNNSLSGSTVTIEVKFLDSIYGVDNPVASSVLYRVLTRPSTRE